MNFEDLYYEELTTATYQELLRVGGWFNQMFGYHPLLVGGWAIYYYNPAGLGSRDVDLIFPDRKLKDRVVNQYLMTHGYERERRSEFEEEYVLLVRTSRGVERVYLDVATVQDPNRVHGADVELPWKLAFDHQRLAKIGDAEFYVPSPEVLILLKVKAAVDREYDAAHVFDPFSLQQKSWKDYYDVTSLLKACEFDTALIASLVKAHRFEPYFQKGLGSLSRKRSVLDRHGVRWRELKGKLGSLV